MEVLAELEPPLLPLSHSDIRESFLLLSVTLGILSHLVTAVRPAGHLDITHREGLWEALPAGYPSVTAPSSDSVKGQNPSRWKRVPYSWDSSVLARFVNRPGYARPSLLRQCRPSLDDHRHVSIGMRHLPFEFSVALN